ncbi:hypothetical protein [Flavobacterium sp.]|uniref:hypothetical protein n=1 Tax=Flavobacterium sp. TaxID=239 RepID=UPI003D0A9659
MIRFELLDIVKSHIPEFEENIEQNIVRAEKILKAEAKMNATVSINDVEAFVAFFVQYGATFFNYLNDTIVRSILKNQEESFELLVNRDRSQKIYSLKFEDESQLDDFAELFQDEIWKFIFSLYQNQQWQVLNLFIIHCRTLLSYDNEEALKDLLDQKNGIILEMLQNPECYNDLITNYPYSISQYYFRMLSNLDEYYFIEEVSSMNSLVVEFQKVKGRKKVCLGKILYAITYFASTDEELSKVLRDNRPIAKEWKGAESSVLSILDNWHYKSLDFKLSNPLMQWSLTSLYYLLLAYVYYLIYASHGVLWLLATFVTQVLVYVILVYFYIGDEIKQKSFLLKHAIQKQIAWSDFMRTFTINNFFLQFYSLMALIIIGFTIALLVVGKGIVGIIVIRFIYQFIKKKV